MIRFVLALSVLILLTSCSSPPRDIGSFTLTIVPTGSGFACVLDGDAPDAWVVTGFGDFSGPLEYDTTSPLRVDFNRSRTDYERVECTAVYPEGNRSVSISFDQSS